MRLEDLKGRRFGRYEIVDLLGRGGMAAVYRAHDTLLRRDVALKLLYAQYGGDTTLVERFQREAVLAARLDHANIVPIYDVGELDGLAYIAMRLLSGRPLADLLADRQILPPAELAPVVGQIADALDYAHARGVVHRDIKPGNILLEGLEGQAITPAVRAVLTDFGIAKSLDTPSLTGTGVLIGTPDYMAPEQIRGDKAVDGRTDIYALGALTYRCLTGRRPFEGSTQEVLIGHLDGRFSPPSALNPALNPAIDPVIRRAMALRPEQRYATAGEFARALASAAGIEPLTPPPGRYGLDPRAVVPRVAADDLARRARHEAATVPGAQARRPAAQPAAAPQHATAAASRQAGARRSTIALVAIALAAILTLGLLIGRLSAGGQQLPPTGAPTLPVAIDPSATLVPPSPSPAEPTATATLAGVPTFPPLTSAPTEIIAPIRTSTPTPIPTATRPAPPTAAPPTATVPPTQTSASSATPTPTSTSTPTLTPTLTPTIASPTLTPTIASPTALTPTPCPITAVGGFGKLLELNDVVRRRMGCAAASEQGGPSSIAEQPFERGSMLYFNPREEIFVLIGVDQGIWYRFEQASLGNLPTPTPAEPPAPGLVVPIRGFGLVWAYNEDIRRQIGYGTAPEAGLLEGAYQRFSGGTMLYSAVGLGRGKSLYVLYNDGTFDRYDDPNP